MQVVLEGLPTTLLALVYLARARSLAAAGRPVPLTRQLLFAGGLLVILVAVATPLAALAEELQWAHMVQHVLLADIASLLIALGLTAPLLRPLLAAPGLRPPSPAVPPGSGAGALDRDAVRLAHPGPIRVRRGESARARR